MLPDNERSRPAGNRTAPDDLLAGGIETDHIANGPSAGGAVPMAEAATVGALLIGRREDQLLILGVTCPSDFTDRRCAFVVSTAERMLAQDVPIDQVTMPGFVLRYGLLAADQPRMLLRSFLVEMVATAPVPASGTWYAAQVLEAAVRRRGSAAGRRISRVFEDGALADLRTVLLAELAAVMAELNRAEVSVNA